ncbi:MAG: hypothetical protein ACHQ4G_07430, partial [Opitutales bacterium]
MRTLHRRICLLRRLNRVAEAEELRLGQFEPACAALHNAGTLAPDRLEQMLADEEGRVEDVLLLADLLAPVLIARLV